MTEANKEVVRRLVTEVFNGGRLEVIDGLYAPELAPAARRWIAPFRASLDVRMEVVELIAEGDKVVGRFTCSATHLGEWARPPSNRSSLRPGRRGVHLPVPRRQDRPRLVAEDSLGRLRQLGLTAAGLTPPTRPAHGIGWAHDAR